MEYDGTENIIKKNKKRVLLVILISAALFTVSLIFIKEGSEYERYEAFLISLSAGIWATVFIYMITEFIEFNFIPHIDKNVNIIKKSLEELKEKNIPNNIEFISSRRGNLGDDFYAPIYRHAHTLTIVGVANTKIIQSLTTVSDDKIKLLNKLDKNNFLANICVGEKKRRVKIILAEPDSDFIKKRDKSDFTKKHAGSGHKTSDDIFASLWRLERLHDYISGEANKVLKDNLTGFDGSIKIYLSSKDLNLSVVLAKPTQYKLDTAYYGMILPDMDGIECPMLAAHYTIGEDDMEGNSVYYFYRDYVTRLTDNGDIPIFSWDKDGTTWHPSDGVKTLLQEYKSNQKEVALEK